MHATRCVCVYLRRREIKLNQNGIGYVSKKGKKNGMHEHECTSVYGIVIGELIQILVTFYTHVRTAAWCMCHTDIAHRAIVVLLFSSCLLCVHTLTDFHFLHFLLTSTFCAPPIFFLLTKWEKKAAAVNKQKLKPTSQEGKEELEEERDAER